MRLILDEWLEYPKELLVDQWTQATAKLTQIHSSNNSSFHQVQVCHNIAQILKYTDNIQTTVICGGGAIPDCVYNSLEAFCSEHNVRTIRPLQPIAAVCKGAVISRVSDKMLGDRLSRASFGIKLQSNGTIYMAWLIDKVCVHALIWCGN